MKTVRLREESYNKLKNKLINEISYGTVGKASRRADDLFYNLKTSFEDFMSELDNSMLNARYDGETDTNPYLEKIKELSKPIYDILSRKGKQIDNFNDEEGKVSIKKYADDLQNMEPDEAEKMPDIDDMEIRDAQRMYPKS